LFQNITQGLGWNEMGNGKRWEDNIKMDLREIGWKNVSSGPGYRPVAGSCEHGNLPSNCIKGSEFLD
jgi:hypothetical protein